MDRSDIGGAPSAANIFANIRKKWKREVPPLRFLLACVAVGDREEVFMEGPIEPNMGPSLADVLL